MVVIMITAFERRGIIISGNAPPGPHWGIGGQADDEEVGLTGRKTSFAGVRGLPLQPGQEVLDPSLQIRQVVSTAK